MKKIFNNKGLTLVEIIITLSVLGVVISPLMAMFVTSQKINRESEKEYDAIQLAQEYMEDIKAMTVLDLNALDLDTRDYIDVDDAFVGEINKDGYDLFIRVVGEAAATEYSEKGITYEQNEGDISIDSNITVNNSLVKNIKVVLKNDNLEINVSNPYGHTVNLYVYSESGKDYFSTVNIEEGSVKVLKNYVPLENKPDNLLYNIEIRVEKNAEEIITIDGTTVFKYKPKSI